MWKVYLFYLLAIVGATAAIKLAGSPWPPTVALLAPLCWMAALASLIIAWSGVAKVVARRKALDRGRALDALDALNLTSGTSRAEFLAAMGPFIRSGWPD